ncbi:hypothetical protein [Vibrio lentus]|uniref:hypothetical protein n=1 Tax=Vibrio lentus TaxID=136468 RepID=UPI001F10053B|nr:hypothetical protein [Vibrio lentus]
MDFEIAFSTVIAAAGSVVSIGFLAKLFANSIATAAIKRFDLVNSKALEEQKQQYSLEIENLKSQLVQLQNEHEVVFSKLYVKREEIITTLYKMMCRFVELSHEKLRDENVDTSELYDQMKDYFEDHRLYFPNEILHKVNRLFVKCGSLSSGECEKEDRQALTNQITVIVYSQIESIFKGILKIEDHQ